MDASIIVTAIRYRGMRIEVLDGRLRVSPKSQLTEKLRSLISEHRAEVIEFVQSGAGLLPKDPLICLVCGHKNWIRNIPGGGVFCGECSDPAEIGLSDGECRPANAEELLRVAESYACWRVRGEGCPDRVFENPDLEPDTLPYRCGSCGRPVTLHRQDSGMYAYKCSCPHGYGRVASKDYERLLAYEELRREGLDEVGYGRP